jgi:phosphoribosylformylglycinamidine synthase
MTNKTYTIYVEKKHPFNVEAAQLLHDLQVNLNIKSLNNIRILNKYTITNITDQTFKGSLSKIFSEPPVDLLFLEQFPKNDTENAFGVTFLPGQFDQRSDSAEQCLKLIDYQTKAKVKTATVYVVDGRLTHTEVSKIKKYLINPTDSCEINVNSHDHDTKLLTPQPIKTVSGFNH